MLTRTNLCVQSLCFRTCAWHVSAAWCSPTMGSALLFDEVLPTLQD